MNLNLKPMLCIHLDTKTDIPKYFDKRAIHLLYCQNKLNGIRALWYPGQGLFSRGGHKITSVPHIIDRLKKDAPNTTLDGELYRSKMPFNRINGAARRIEPTLDSLSLEYHIFDTFSESKQSIRLSEASFIPESLYIKHIETPIINAANFDLALKIALHKGYEGIVLRTLNTTYRPGRHVGNLWAIKPVYELEATFVGFLDGETDLHEDTFGSMLLKLPNERTFSCSGIKEYDRIRLWNHPPPQGTPVTIKFGAWSHKDKDKAVPLYPRFKCVRWDL